MSTCTKCNVNASNPNQKWCQPCFLSSRVSPSLCVKCNRVPPNKGRSFCQNCYLADRGDLTTSNQPPLTTSTVLCTKCNTNPPNPGYPTCQSCYQSDMAASTSTPIIMFIVPFSAPDEPPTSGSTTTTPSKPALTNNATTCVACKKNNANNGFTMCQQCFDQKNSASSQLCTTCMVNAPNPGYSKCGPCHEASKLCGKCKTAVPNAGKKWCQKCFDAKNSKLCTMCKQKPHNKGFSLCQNCHDFGNTLKLVPTKSNKSNKYQTIEKQFHDGMAKKNYKGKIIEILSVFDKSRYTRYETYKQTIARRNNNKANEKRWWHGSNLGCDLWKTKHVCNASCHICNIIQSGFLMKYANSKNSWGRFGAGLYFAPDAAKSNDYTVPHNKVRCLILCKVVVGNARVFTEDQPNLTAPPPGFDSVLGKPGTGGVLNFPELVVYTEEAILPAYAVFYQT